MDEMQGSIKLFGGTYAPRNFALCMGQLTQISENQALFAILGTTWGGDGRTSFAMPDMRGRVPSGVGRGPGLTEVYQGYRYGFESVTLTTRQLPAHDHDAVFSPTGGGSGEPITAAAAVKACSGSGTENSPAGNYWALGSAVDGRNSYPVQKGFSKTSDVMMASDAVTVDIGGGGGGITGGTVAVGNTGSGQPFSIMQPTLGMQYIIATEGYFPSRN